VCKKEKEWVVLNKKRKKEQQKKKKKKKKKRKQRELLEGFPGARNAPSKGKGGGVVSKNKSYPLLER